MADTKHRSKMSRGYLVKEGFRYIKINKLMSLASVTVLLACLLIVGSAFLIYINIDAVIEHVGEQNVIMVFVDDDASEEEQETLLSQILSIEGVSDAEYIANYDAFADILADMGDAAEILTDEDGSFLPDAYKITVSDMDSFSAVVSSLTSLDNVLSVRENTELADKLVTMRTAVSYICICVVTILFVVSLFIVANTIRITIFSRSLEISIMKAVGATNAFIRWPFVIEGIVLGLIAAVLSFGILWGLYEAAGAVFTELFTILGSDIVPFETYMWYILAVFAAIGVITGAFGSSLSLGKYLKEHGKVVES